VQQSPTQFYHNWYASLH